MFPNDYYIVKNQTYLFNINWEQLLSLKRFGDTKKHIPRYLIINNCGCIQF